LSHGIHLLAIQAKTSTLRHAIRPGEILMGGGNDLSRTRRHIVVLLSGTRRLSSGQPTRGLSSGADGGTIIAMAGPHDVTCTELALGLRIAHVDSSDNLDSGVRARAQIGAFAVVLIGEDASRPVPIRRPDGPPQLAMSGMGRERLGHLERVWP
jgi:hypothetical protein